MDSVCIKKEYLDMPLVVLVFSSETYAPLRLTIMDMILNNRKDFLFDLGRKNCDFSQKKKTILLPSQRVKFLIYCTKLEAFRCHSPKKKVMKMNRKLNVSHQVK